MNNPLDYRVDLSDYRDVKRVAGELAAQLGWRLGQDPEGKIVIKRGVGQAPKPFRTWVGAYTWLRDILIDRRASIPVAQLAPPVAETWPPPMAEIVEVDAQGRRIG